MEPQPVQWRDLKELQSALGYQFKRIELLETALQHSSYAHETPGCESNERLEFLGDSVLGVVVAHILYETHPGWAEGQLTRTLANLVERKSLARLGAELELGAYLRLGRTEQQSGGKEKPAILADAVEAVLGAIYLDAGLEPVEILLKRLFAEAFAADAAPVERDPKTRLQESVMADRGVLPTYACVRDSGIDGDDERFTVEVSIDGRMSGEGIARSKRLAERHAAAEALLRIDSAESRE
jgi:ribonuclease-3